MYVKATDKSGKWTRVHVTVVDPEVFVTPNNAETTFNKTVQLSSLIKPIGNTKRTAVWTSSDESIATVDINGLVSTKEKAGRATITARYGAKTASCDVIVNNPVTGIELTPTTKNILVNEQATLKAKLETALADYDGIEWFSSDPEIATVENGVVYARSAGIANIIARSTANPNVFAHATITVRDLSVSIDQKPSITLRGGEIENLSATVGPEWALDKSVVWSSEDTDVASVDPETGRLVTEGIGETRVTATTATGSQASIMVKVIWPIDSIKTSTDSLEIITGNKGKISADVEPAEHVNHLMASAFADNIIDGPMPPFAFDGFVFFEVDDSNIAQVDRYTGEITARKPGQTYITVRSFLNPTLRKRVLVTVTDYTVSLDHTNITLIKGEQFKVKATVSPENAVNKNLEWEVEDYSVADVRDDGLITALEEGTTRMAAFTDSGAYAELLVTVINPVNKITVDPTNATIPVAGRVQLTAQNQPALEKYEGVRWESDDIEVANVDGHGEVLGMSPGVAHITATSIYNDQAVARATITVVGQGLVLNSTNETIVRGKSFKATARVLPDSVVDKSVTWSSEDATIASVSDEGIIKGMKTGETTITATSAVGVTADMKVSIVSPVQRLDVAPGSAAVPVFGTYKFTASTLPVLQETEGVDWTSSDPEIAAIDDEGVVTTLKPGAVTITATAKADDTKKATARLTVLDLAVKASVDNLTLSTGEASKLSATVSPSNATNKTLVWSSANSNVATINAETGRIEAVGAGETSIFATSASGSKAEVIVKVINQEVFLNPTSAQIVRGKSFQATARVLPGSVTNKTVTWSSDDTSTASVSDQGLIKGMKIGETTITATSAFGATTSMRVEILSPVQRLDIGPATASVPVFGTYKFTASVLPVSEETTGVVWESSDPEVAEINEDGAVTTFKPGIVTITATSKVDNTKKATARLTILDLSVHVSTNNIELSAGEAMKLSAMVTPSNAPNKTLTWTSANSDIATVNAESGRVEGVSAGETSIFATSASGSKAEVLVKVRAVPVASINFNSQTTTLSAGSGMFVENGKEVTIPVNVAPSNATIKTFSITNHNDEIIEARAEDGAVVVKGLKAGIAQIHVVSDDTDANQSSEDISIEVYDNAAKVTGTRGILRSGVATSTAAVSGNDETVKVWLGDKLEVTPEVASENDGPVWAWKGSWSMSGNAISPASFQDEVSPYYDFIKNDATKFALWDANSNLVGSAFTPAKRTFTADNAGTAHATYSATNVDGSKASYKTNVEVLKPYVTAFSHAGATGNIGENGLSLETTLAAGNTPMLRRVTVLGWASDPYEYTGLKSGKWSITGDYGVIDTTGMNFNASQAVFKFAQPGEATLKWTPNNGGKSTSIKLVVHGSLIP